MHTVVGEYNTKALCSKDKQGQELSTGGKSVTCVQLSGAQTGWYIGSCGPLASYCNPGNFSKLINLVK